MDIECHSLQIKMLNIYNSFVQVRRQQETTGIKKLYNSFFVMF